VPVRVEAGATLFAQDDLRDARGEHIVKGGTAPLSVAPMRRPTIPPCATQRNPMPPLVFVSRQLCHQLGFAAWALSSLSFTIYYHY
jgi:hypothetical protein